LVIEIWVKSKTEEIIPGTRNSKRREKENKNE